MRTTLAQPDGTVHAVDMPDIPADYPGGGTVNPTSVCGIGNGEGLPANLARQTRHPSFRGRAVTCSACLVLLSTEAVTA